MTWDSACLAHFQTRIGNHFEQLVWFRARTLDTGDPVEFGFWTGKTDRTLTVDGASRGYFGAQGGIAVPPVEYGKGLSVETVTVSMSISPELDGMVRGYDCTDAAFEWHVALFHPFTRLLIGTDRRFRGFVDTISHPLPEEGGASATIVRAMTTNVIGTMVRAGGKSDADQKRRDEEDTMLEFASLGQTSNDPWGSKA